jgi:hypothetical protein
MIENAVIGKAMGDSDLSNIWNNNRDTINIKLASMAVSCLSLKVLSVCLCRKE